MHRRTFLCSSLLSIAMAPGDDLPRDAVHWLPAGLPPANPSGPTLCVGACLSPEQGKDLLDQALRRFPDRGRWDAYAQHVRERIQQGLGLAPWPQRTALNAVVH